MQPMRKCFAKHYQKSRWAIIHWIQSNDQDTERHAIVWYPGKTIKSPYGSVLYTCLETWANHAITLLEHTTAKHIQGSALIHSHTLLIAKPVRYLKEQMQTLSSWLYTRTGIARPRNLASPRKWYQSPSLSEGSTGYQKASSSISGASPKASVIHKVTTAKAKRDIHQLWSLMTSGFDNTMSDISKSNMHIESSITKVKHHA